jgi:hypothetical protein
MSRTKCRGPYSLFGFGIEQFGTQDSWNNNEWTLAGCVLRGSKDLF